MQLYVEELGVERTPMRGRNVEEKGLALILTSITYFEPGTTTPTPHPPTPVHEAKSASRCIAGFGEDTPVLVSYLRGWWKMCPELLVM